MECFYNFVDGTVENTDLSNTGLPPSQSFTYYGGSCISTGWDRIEHSCGVWYSNTASNEQQRIGTYYNYQASTSGSGYSLATDNANVSDTFCPLGWQLPYSGTGGDYYDQSKSWNYLLARYNYINDATGSIGIRSYPLDYVFSGYYLGKGVAGANYGMVAWSSTVKSANGSYRLYSTNNTLQSSSSDTKESAQTVRCAL